MEIKDVIPLVGVFVGWLLSTISTNAARSIENRKIINRTITTLMHMLRETKRAHSLLKGGRDYYKDDFTESERIRTMELHLQPISLEHHIKVAEELAGCNPILSVQLHDILISQKAFMNQNLKSVEAAPELYEYMLTLFDSVYEVSSVKLEKMILRLALQKGIVSWLRYQFFFRFQEKDMPNWGVMAGNIAKGFFPNEDKS